MGLVEAGPSLQAGLSKSAVSSGNKPSTLIPAQSVRGVWGGEGGDDTAAGPHFSRQLCTAGKCPLIYTTRREESLVLHPPCLLLISILMC